MKNAPLRLALLLAMLGAATAAPACTNLLVTKGASEDGSTMLTYSADSYQMFGELYHYPAAKYRPGTMLDVYEWDAPGHLLGQIPQVRQTYNVIGNMNEKQVAITETTFGGRPELCRPNGILDYGSLIYITLQRAASAREAIEIMTSLVAEYGYYSEGESFSIADPDEVWIMELIGKGEKEKGAVWVARRVPDGYICAHANQARITTFPLDDPDNCLYSPDVISFAREMGYYEGPDAEFSFCDAYAPADFSALRACEARVWSFFRRVADGMDAYTDYAMGHNPANRMPLWVKPSKKVSPKEVFDAMRDHYEGTPMDMTRDLGAGGCGLPYRWRPMSFEVDGTEYVNERATATQQTGFWLVAQANRAAGDDLGILWFGVDDAATSCLTPIYCSIDRVPECLSENNGSMLKYSPTSMFWLFNRVTNFAYLRYDRMSKDLQAVADRWENRVLGEVREVTAEARKLEGEARVKYVTDYSVMMAQTLFDLWKQMDEYLLVKYIDGNVKGETEPGKFKDNGNGRDIPGEILFPGYDEKWQRAVAADNGETLKVIKN